MYTLVRPTVRVKFNDVIIFKTKYYIAYDSRRMYRYLVAVEDYGTVCIYHTVPGLKQIRI